MEDFIEFPISTPSGIYLLLLDDVVVYVGQTKNIYARLGTHCVALAGKFNRILFSPCNQSQLEALEAQAIERYKPTMNKRIPELKSNCKVDLNKLGFTFQKYWEKDDARRCR